MTVELVLQRRAQPDYTNVLEVGESLVLLSPTVNEDYWEYRVGLSEGQAVVGFPKFGTIGIGFAVEETDWNTNLPFMLRTDEIVEHIWRNRGSSVRSRATVTEAVRLIQAAAFADRIVEAELGNDDRLRDHLLERRTAILGEAEAGTG